MRTYGYARVSTAEQILDRQLDMLSKYGVDRIYSEKMTGTRRDRPQLQRMLTDLDKGDTVVVESLSRSSEGAQRTLLNLWSCLMIRV